MGEGEEEREGTGGGGKEEGEGGQGRGSEEGKQEKGNKGEGIKGDGVEVGWDGGLEGGREVVKEGMRLCRYVER